MTPEEECLLLWKTLSELPDTNAIRLSSSFKNNILLRLGIGKRLSGCPLCHVYLNNDCPLGKCGKSALPCLTTPYFNWEEELLNGKHNQTLAKQFYTYLQEKLCSTK